MNKHEKIGRLFFRYLRNELTGREKAQLAGWRKASPRNEQLFLKETDPQNLRQAILRIEEIKEKVYNRLRADYPGLKAEPVKIRASIFSRRAGIAVIIIFLLTLIFYVKFHVPYHTRPGQKPDPAMDAMMMPDGSFVGMDNFTRGFRTGLAGIDLYTNKNGFYTYILKNATNKPYDQRFGIYRAKSAPFVIQFPDGSLIWPNVNTTFEFPANLSQDTIRLVIQGEAYVQMAARSNTRFLIEVPPTSNRTQQTRILASGSYFNLTAYDEDRAVIVSLRKGNTYILPDSSNAVSYRKKIDLVPWQMTEISDTVTAKPFKDLKPIISWLKW